MTEDEVGSRAWLSEHGWSSVHQDKVFIQASGLACEVYVEVSPLRSLPTMVCEI